MFRIPLSGRNQPLSERDEVGRRPCRLLEALPAVSGSPAMSSMPKSRSGTSTVGRVYLGGSRSNGSGVSGRSSISSFAERGEIECWRRRVGMRLAIEFESVLRRDRERVMPSWSDEWLESRGRVKSSRKRLKGSMRLSRFRRVGVCVSLEI